jgi:hypothetical protein
VAEQPARAPNIRTDDDALGTQNREEEYPDCDIEVRRAS